MKIVCNQCNRDFEAKNKMLKEWQMDSEYREVYFNCPHCGNKYRVALHNAETKRLQKKIRKAENTGNQEEVQELKVKLKIEMDRINGK